MNVRVFNVFFDKVIDTITEYGDLDMDFYKSDLWPSRPNSTARLNLMNYAAFNNLKEVMDVENYRINEFDDVLISAFSQYDYVVIHQNASKKTFSIMREIFRYLDNNKITAKIVFGTEGTWSSTKEFLSENNIDDIYKKHLLLRHTAKTDRDFYSNEKCVDLNVKEFELGIDTDLLSTGRMIESRKYISFVAAPEGRVTKNNDLIYQIVERLEIEKLGYEIKILTPPYSSEEYWDVMSKSAFFIFTSNSETFSYCLNDAKALGAITFFPTHMFCTKIGARFVVDNYPESGHRYSSVDEVLKIVKDYISDSNKMAISSNQSRQFVVDNHSIDRLTHNWKKLLLDDEYETEKLYIYDRSRDQRSLLDIESYCRDNNIKYAMPYLNLDRVSWVDDKFTYIGDGVVFLKYYLSCISGKIKRGFYMNDESQFRFGVGASAGVEKDVELIPYLSLIKRINKISEVIIDQSVDSPELVAALDKLGLI